MTTAPAAPAPLRASVRFGAKPPISASGRPCDRCPSARARGKAVFATGDLYLCGHHLHVHYDALVTQALELVIDTPGRDFHLTVPYEGTKR